MITNKIENNYSGPLCSFISYALLYTWTKGLNIDVNYKMKNKAILYLHHYRGNRNKLVKTHQPIGITVLTLALTIINNYRFRQVKKNNEK